MRRTQFFEDSEYFGNLLTVSDLWLNTPSCPSNIASNSFSFKFLFIYTFNAVIYTLLNISTEP